MATYIITGGAGFIGSHLADRLLDLGNKVVVVDNFQPYYDRSIKESNISQSRKNPNYIFLEEDVGNKEKFREIVKKFKPDGIFHIAAIAGVRYSVESPEIYLENNIKSTLSVLEAAKEGGTKVVFASSSSVYGDPKFMPLTEEHPTIPNSPYGASKVACEALINSYVKIYKIPVTILRYFSVYGPRQRPDMGINKFITALLRKETITVFGDGSQTRDFTYVGDVIDATVNAMVKNVTGVFNIGGGHRISLNELMKTIEEVTKEKLKKNFIEEQKGDVSDTWADTSKARKSLEFNPKFDIRKGIEQEHIWLKKVLNM